MTTQAAFFTQPKSIEVQETEITPEERQELYTSVTQGISAGTEMLFYNGTFPKELSADDVIPELGQQMAYPLKYGYVNVGQNADGVTSFFFQPHQRHWYANPEEGLTLPTGISADDGLFMAQVETALGIVQDLRPVAGETVLVMGAGVVGLLTAAIMELSHWGNVYLADKDSRKEKWTSLFNLDFIDASRNGWKDQLSGNGDEVDCGVNATSSDSALQDLIDLSGFEATIVEASWYGSKPVTLNLGSSFHRKRLHLVSSQVSRVGSSLSARWNKERRFSAVLDLIRELKPSRLISHRFPFMEIQNAFECIEKGREAVMQVVLDC